MFFVAGLHSGRVSGGVAFHSRLRAGWRYRACSGHRGIIGRVLDAQVIVGRYFAVFSPSSVRIPPEDQAVVRISPENAAVSGTGPSKSAPGREPAQTKTIRGVGRARWRLASSVPSPSPVITERLPTDRVPLRNLPYDSPIYALRRTLPHGDNAGRGCFERKATYGRCTCTPR